MKGWMMKSESRIWQGKERLGRAAFFSLFAIRDSLFEGELT